MKKRNIIIGFVIIILSVVVMFAANIFAENTGGGRKGPPPVRAEPLSYLLILAGGATLAILRRWRIKRNSRNLR